LKFFIERTPGKQWTSFDLIRPPREKKLPVILSIEEVQTILRQMRLPALPSLSLDDILCGLRLQEGTHIQVRDIDNGECRTCVIDFFDLSSKHSANGLQNFLMRKRFLEHLLYAECLGDLQVIHRARAASS
jgi:integrase